MKYEEKDIPQFVEEVCKKCWFWENGVDNGCKNILSKNNKQWFLYCGKFFNWKLGIKTWDELEREWQEAHPEEVKKREEQYLAYLERKKKEQAEKRKAKAKEKKEKEGKTTKKKTTTKKVKKEKE